MKVQICFFTGVKTSKLNCQINKLIKPSKHTIKTRKRNIQSKMSILMIWYSLNGAHSGTRWSVQSNINGWKHDHHVVCAGVISIQEADNNSDECMHYSNTQTVIFCILILCCCRRRCRAAFQRFRIDRLDEKWRRRGNDPVYWRVCVCLRA